MPIWTNVRTKQELSTHLHVLLKLVAPLQVVHVSLDWHVVQAEQVVEHNAKVLEQLLLVYTLKGSTPT